MGKYLNSITGNSGTGGSGGGGESKKVVSSIIGGGGSGGTNGSAPNQTDSAIEISSLSQLSSGSGGGNVTEYQKQVELTHNKLPKDDSQLKHIFRKSKKGGHLLDTPENRKLILELANNPKHYIGVDSIGRHWYAHNLADGSQLWAFVINGKIGNAGKNSEPFPWNEKTGFYRNIEETPEWRGGKKNKEK